MLVLKPNFSSSITAYKFIFCTNWRKTQPKYAIAQQTCYWQNFISKVFMPPNISILRIHCNKVGYRSVVSQNEYTWKWTSCQKDIEYSKNLFHFVQRNLHYNMHNSKEYFNLFFIVDEVLKMNITPFRI